MVDGLGFGGSVHLLPDTPSRALRAFEPLVITFITLAVYALLRARENMLCLCAAEVAFVLAVLTKQTAFYMLLFAIGFGLDALVKGRARGSRRLSQGIVVGLGLLLAAGVGKYVARPDYLRTVFWDYGHATKEALTALGVTHGLIRIGPDWTRTVLQRTFPMSSPRRPPSPRITFYVRATVMTLCDFGGPLGAPSLRRSAIAPGPGVRPVVNASPAIPRP